MSNDQNGGQQGWNPASGAPGGQQPGQSGWSPYGQNQPGQNQPGQNQPGQNQPGHNQGGQNQGGQNQGTPGYQPTPGWPTSAPSASPSYGAPAPGPHPGGGYQTGSQPTVPQPTVPQSAGQGHGSSQPYPPQQTYPPNQTYSTGQFGGPGGYPPHQSGGFQSPAKKSYVPFIAAALGLLLIVGVLVMVTRNRQSANPQDPATTAATAPTSEAPTTEAPTTDAPTSEAPTSEAPTPEPSAEIPEAAKAPGPGNKAAIQTELERQGFICEEEKGQPFTSMLCTHFKSSPIMFAYVAAHPDGTLGRVALSVQSKSQPATSKEISDYLIGQFADEASVSTITKKIAASDTTYASGTTDRFSFRGRSDGSIVMYAPDFALDGKPVTQDITGANMQAMLKSKGYTCALRDSNTRSVFNCVKGKAPAAVVTVQYFSPAPTENVVYTNIRADGPSSQVVTKAFLTELPSVYGEVSPDLATRMLAFVRANGSGSGGTAFSQNNIFDFYPPNQGTKGWFVAFYLRASCWENRTTNC